MKAFLRAACGPAPDEAKIDAYCDGSVEHHDWLVARGVQFVGRFDPEGGGTSPGDDEGLMFTGGENAWPFDEQWPAVPRAHCTKGARPGGAALMAALSRAAPMPARALGTTSATERLVTDDAGRVCGVVATEYGTTKNVRAHRGVVLAAGGFVNNPEMVAEYAPAMHLTRVAARHRGRRRSRHSDGAGGRRRGQAHGRDRMRAAVQCPAQLEVRHPRQWPRPPVRQRGHLHGPCRAACVAARGRPGVPDRRRGALCAELAGRDGEMGVRDARELGVRDRAAAGFAAGHDPVLQRPTPSVARIRCSTSASRCSHR